MTVSSTTTRVTYAGNGVTTAFATTFPFFAANEIEVVERVVATGAETVKALTTHYTVSGGNGATGTVTAVAAPSAAVQWLLRRKTARTQEIDYTPNDPFPAETHEQGLDRLKMNVQELGEEQDRALRFPRTDSASLSAELPSSLARAGKYLAFDAAGAPVATSGTSSSIVVSAFMESVLDDASAAAARATLDAPSNAEALLDTLIDAKGDLIVGTAPDSPARLAVGADGQVLVADSAQSAGVRWGAAGSRGGASNLKVTNNATTPNTQIDITADRAVMITPTGAAVFDETVAVIIDLTTGSASAAANGMDGTPRPAGGWVYLWLISNGATTAGLASLSSTAPTLPAGYGYKTYVGAMRCDGAQNLLRTLQRGRRAQYVLNGANGRPIIVNALSGTAFSASAVTWSSAQSVDAAIPLTGQIGYFVSSSGGLHAVAPNSNSTGWGGSNPPPIVGSHANTSVPGWGAGSFLLESRNIFVAANGASVSVWADGWDDMSVST